MARTRGGLPFRDLVVIDVASLAAAPQIAAFLGDFGARVIKVEPPRGDPLRRIVDADGAPLQWKIVNRNKECVTLDLGRPRGRAVLGRMLERADVLVSAYTEERLERFDLGPQTLRRAFPRLVAVNLTAYGAAGPWADRPGSGTLAEAVGGLAALTGEADGPPGLSPVGLGDTLGVLQGIIAVLLGLYAREASSAAGGDAFDVAMVEPVLALLSSRIAAADRAGVDPVRSGNRFPTMAPRNTYATADGHWVALTAGTDDLARRVLTCIGRPELADDDRFASNRARVANVEELDRLIADWIGARSSDEVVSTFVGARVSLALVEGPTAVARNPHVLARGNLVRTTDDELGSILVPSPSPRGSSTVGEIRFLGRGLGADNDAVYGEWLGLSDAERAALAVEGVI